VPASLQPKTDADETLIVDRAAGGQG
jgi:hypothetical protein